MTWTGEHNEGHGTAHQGVVLLDRALEPTRDGPIASPEDFVMVLGNVGEYVEGAGIPPGFNKVYHRLSELVFFAATGGVWVGDRFKSPAHTVRFEHPDDVLHTMSIFGDYWYKPLRRYVDDALGRRNTVDHISPAWHEALDPKLMKAAPGLQFVLGMMAHIRARDLAASLYESQVSEEYHADYTDVVQDLIMETTIAMSPQLVPGHRLLRRTVRTPVVAAIGHMREIAWDNSRLLDDMKDPVQQEQFMQKLDRQAATHIAIAKRLGSIVLGAASVTEHLPFAKDAPERLVA